MVSHPVPRLLAAKRTKVLGGIDAVLAEYRASAKRGQTAHPSSLLDSLYGELVTVRDSVVALGAAGTPTASALTDLAVSIGELGSATRSGTPAAAMPHLVAGLTALKRANLEAKKAGRAWTL